MKNMNYSSGTVQRLASDSQKWRSFVALEEPCTPAGMTGSDDDDDDDDDDDGDTRRERKL